MPLSEEHQFLGPAGRGTAQTAERSLLVQTRRCGVLSSALLATRRVPVFLVASTPGIFALSKIHECHAAGYRVTVPYLDISPFFFNFDDCKARKPTQPPMHCLSLSCFPVNPPQKSSSVSMISRAFPSRLWLGPVLYLPTVAMVLASGSKERPSSNSR